MSSSQRTITFDCWAKTIFAAIYRSSHYEFGFIRRTR